MSQTPITIRVVTDPHDAAIGSFGEMQDAAYFAPETLIPARYIPRLLAPEPTPSDRRNLLLVAEHHGRVVGGTLFHWLAEPGVGFSSFLGVDRHYRGQDIARRLHQRRFEVLDGVAGRPGGAKGVFIDVVNPSRLPDADLERESSVGSDPWIRRRAFAHLGFRQVDIRYEQPVGGPGGGPVTVLDLLYCPRTPSDTVPTDLVVRTMRAYWSPWLGERALFFAAQLRARAGDQQNLRLISPEVHVEAGGSA